MNPLVPLIQTYRGGTLDCMHYGAVAVVDTRGQVLAHAGDAHWVAFTRSTLKPLQALPFLQAQGPQKMGFTREHVAMMCASHSGEAMHVERVEQMLDKAGVSYRRLKCGCHVPYYADLGVAPRPEPGTYDERHHNCSGKHSGMVAYCALHGLDIDSYWEPQHPLQQAIREHVARAVGLAADDLKLGIDGCSVPNYAMPLSALARGYARLASGAADPEFGASFAQLADAMTARPDLVSGTGRADKAFMEAGRGDWVTKAGADGIHAIASRSRGEALVVKVIDGNAVALQAACVAALDQLGWLDDEQREQLRPWRAQALLNVRKAQVGERRPVFALQANRAGAGVQAGM